VVLLVLGFHAAAVGTTSGQVSANPPPIEIGGTFGIAVIGAAGAPTSQCYRPEAGMSVIELGFRGGYRLSRRLVVEATLGNTYPPADDIACPPPRDPRTAGEDTLSIEYPSAETHGFLKATTTAVRVSVIPWSRSTAEVRLYMGIARIWQSHVLPIVAGFNGRVHLGPLDLFTEVETSRYSVDLIHRDQFFTDGSITSTRETTSKRGRWDAALRIGIGIRP
jgi:hypothetical protein